MKRYCLAAVITASLGVSYSAQAYNCAGVPVWDSSTVYVGSDKVQKTNTAYQARYWTQGNDPVTHSGQWDAWQILGQCDGGRITHLKCPFNHHSITPRSHKAPSSDYKPMPQIVMAALLRWSF